MHPVYLIPMLGISCGLLAVFGGVILRPWMRFQQRKLELEAEILRSQAGVDLVRHERLEARVAVLERIVTDRGQDLAVEFERLRGAPLN